MGVVHAVQQAMNTVIDWPDFLRKLVALGSDGAAVMLGKKQWCDITLASITAITDCSPLFWPQAWIGLQRCN